MDDITLPQLSLVSGVPNISCAGEFDPLVSTNHVNQKMNRAPAPRMAMMQQQVQYFSKIFARI